MTLELLGAAGKSFLFAFATLLPILNPAATAPIFLGLTEGASAATRAVLARRIARNMVALLLGSMVVGYPFLTSHTFHWNLPLIGAIHLASATFFDIGVFTLVVGSTLLILTALAHQSVRAHRYHARTLEEALRLEEDRDNDKGMP